MKQDAWLRCHVHAFAFFGGCTPIIVPDNLLTGVKKHPKEGEVVPSEACRELAAHYGAAVLPARVRHPRDKPSAENEAWCATMYVIGALRGRAFEPCQYNGQWDSRFYAASIASGSYARALSKRSKNSCIASAGTRSPMDSCGR